MDAEPSPDDRRPAPAGPDEATFLANEGFAELADLVRERDAARSERNRLAAEASRLATELEEAEAERDRLEAAVAELAESREELRMSRVALVERRDALQAMVHETNARFKKGLDRQADLRQHRDDLRRQRDELLSRLSAAEEQIASLQRGAAGDAG